MRHENVSCSQCGQDFGPGNHGFSACQDHRTRCHTCNEPDAGYVFSNGRRVCHSCLNDELAVMQLQAYAAAKSTRVALQALAA